MYDLPFCSFHAVVTKGLFTFTTNLCSSCVAGDGQSLWRAMSGGSSANNSWTILTPEVSPPPCKNYRNVESLCMTSLKRQFFFKKKTPCPNRFSFGSPEYEVGFCNKTCLCFFFWWFNSYSETSKDRLYVQISLYCSCGNVCLFVSFDCFLGNCCWNPEAFGWGEGAPWRKPYICGRFVTINFRIVRLLMPHIHLNRFNF